MTLAAKFVGIAKRNDRRNVEREVEIMRELQHPRLIQIYDAFESSNVMCVVLELIEGGELFDRVIDDDFVLTEKAVAIFMRQICEGVDFIHSKNVLHLDMKPENILCLTKTGNRIKIIDFGLARKFDPEKKLQVLFGTPEFVAPEVVNFDAISYGTDMWSVGVICYVLLSGLSPFMGETDVQTMANVTIANYDFDDECFNEISEDAKDFIRKLLLKDITARMTASQSLQHPWLSRHPTPDPNLSNSKENIKECVERWSPEKQISLNTKKNLKQNSPPTSEKKLKLDISVADDGKENAPPNPERRMKHEMDRTPDEILEKKIKLETPSIQNTTSQQKNTDSSTNIITDMSGTTTVIDKKSKLHPPPTPEIESAMKTENISEKKMKVHTPFTPEQPKESPLEKMEVDVPSKQIANEKNTEPEIKLSYIPEEKVNKVPGMPKSDSITPLLSSIPETSKSTPPEALKSPTIENKSNEESLTSTPTKNKEDNLTREIVQEPTSKNKNTQSENQKTSTSDNNSNVQATSPVISKENLVQPTLSREPPPNKEKCKTPSPDVDPKTLETKAPATKQVEPSPTNKTDSIDVHTETKVETQPKPNTNVPVTQNKPSSPVPKTTEESSDKHNKDLVSPKTLKSSSPTSLSPARNENPNTTVPLVKPGIDNLPSKSVQSPIIQEPTVTTENTQRTYYEKLSESITPKISTITSSTEILSTPTKPVTTPTREEKSPETGPLLTSDKNTSTTTKPTTESLQQAATKTMPLSNKVQVTEEKKESPSKPTLKITVPANKETVASSTSLTPKPRIESIARKTSSVTTPGADKVTTPKQDVTQKEEILVKPTIESNTQPTPTVKPANKENIASPTSLTLKPTIESIARKTSSVTTPGADKVTTPKTDVTQKEEILVKPTIESITQPTPTVKPANKENVASPTSLTPKPTIESIARKTSSVTTPGADKVTTPKPDVTQKEEILVKPTVESNTQPTPIIKPKDDDLLKSSTRNVTISMNDRENKEIATIRKPKFEKLVAVDAPNVTVTENIAKLKIEDKPKDHTEKLQSKTLKETGPTSPSSSQVSQTKGVISSKLTTSENKLSSSSISSADSSSPSSPSRIPNSNPLNIPIISSGRIFQRGMSKSSSPDTRSNMENQSSSTTDVPSKTQSTAQSIHAQNDEIIQKISELTRTATNNTIPASEAAPTLRTIRVKRLESESTEVTSEKTTTIKSDGKKSEENIKASTTSKEIKSTSTANKTNNTNIVGTSGSKEKTAMNSTNKNVEAAGTSSSASLTLKVPKIITHEIRVETDEGDRVLSPDARRGSAEINRPRLNVMDDFRQDRRCSDISCFFPGENEFISEEISRLSDRLKDLKSCSFDNGSDADNLLNRIRRPKYRISNHSRDVPVNSPPPASNLAYYMRTSSQSPRSQSPSDDVLIKFLTQFNDKVDAKTKPKTLDVNKKDAPATAAV
ncbi:hypothetical protein WDU94_012121 [Cyamophila willieti]